MAIPSGRSVVGGGHAQGRGGREEGFGGMGGTPRLPAHSNNGLKTFAGGPGGGRGAGGGERSRSGGAGRETMESLFAGGMGDLHPSRADAQFGRWDC
jgi:hypothetical protein